MSVLRDRIRAGLEASCLIQMPYLKGDEAREAELHALGRAEGCATHTVRFVAFRGKTERYGLVQMEREPQPQRQGSLL